MRDDSNVRWHGDVHERDDSPDIAKDVGNSPLLDPSLVQDLARLHNCFLLQKCMHVEWSEKNALLPIFKHGHGFMSGEPIRLSGTEWVKADASTVETCAQGFAQRIDTNRFRVILNGMVHADDAAWQTIAGGPLAAGTIYYLSDTAGRLATTPGTVVQQVIVAVSRERAVILLGSGDDGSIIGLHATTHQQGGADAIKLDDLATPDDNTDLNATTLHHGLLPKLSGTATQFLSGSGTWGTPAGTFVHPDPHQLSDGSLSAPTYSFASARSTGMWLGEGDTPDLNFNNGAGLLVFQVTGSGAVVNGNFEVTGKLTVAGLIDPTGLVCTEQAGSPHSTAAGEGTFYVRNTAPSLPYFEGDTGTDTELLTAARNLAGLDNPITARSNLGLGSAALLSSTAVLQVANDLSDLNSPSTARTNLGVDNKTIYGQATPGDVAVNSVTHVALLSKALTGLVAGDVIDFELQCIILNNSGANRTYNLRISLGTFVIDLADGAVIAASASSRALLTLKGSIAIISTSVARGGMEFNRQTSSTNGTAASGVLAQNRMVWNNTASDLTGSQTALIGMHGGNATATQTCTVINANISKRQPV